MLGRRLPRIAAAALAVVAATLAGCTDDGSPSHPRPSGASEATDDGVLQLAEARFQVGPPELVVGPTTYVDSLVNAVRAGDKIRAYVGRGDTVLLEGTDVTDLAPTGDLAIARGDKTGFDRCGAWLDAVEQDPRHPDLLRAWYHAETDCAYSNHQTHKSIAYAESRDGGRTFTKPGYPDNQVVRGPAGGVTGERTGRGDFSVVRRGRYYYMYYLNVLPDFSTGTSVARAPVSSGGVPGSWRNYTETTDGRGSWTSDALGGPAADLGMKVAAASASIHSPSGEVMLVRQNSPSNGIVLQASTDGIHFERLHEPVVPYLRSQIRSDWGVTDQGQIFGYVSAVALDGSRTWDDAFYLFHMYVFPGDGQREQRYLVRRKVTVTEAPADGPWSTIAISTFHDAAADDRFETSAPVKPEASYRDVLGYALATPSPDRNPLFECTAIDGDRFVGGACSDSAREGRLVGYAYRDEQPGTAALHRCATDQGDQFATLDPECEGRGRVLSDLGYVFPPS